MRSIDDNATMPDKEALSNGPRGQISMLVHRFVHPPLSLLYRHLSDATISSHLLLMHRSLSSRFVRVHRPPTTSSRKIRSSLISSASYKHNTSLPQVKKIHHQDHIHSLRTAGSKSLLRCASSSQPSLPLPARWPHQ